MCPMARIWNMSESMSHKCILAVTLVALGFVSNALASSNLAFEQLADSRPPDAGIPAASEDNHSDPVPNAATSPADASSSKAPSAAAPSGALDCGNLENAAATQGLPVDFFTRLIRQESNFDPKAVSRAGAQGIAQFMPGTARWRGLSDPFEPAASLKESARWLRELRDQFGNLGLAAAAYNAGPKRVRNWLAGRGELPHETRAYVRIVTGRRVEEWMGVSTEMPFDPPTGPCAQVAKRASPPAEHHMVDVNVDLAPWGLQLIGDSSESRALSAYADLQKRYRSVLGDRAPTVLKRPMGGRGPSTWYFVRVAESTREKATQLCSRLKSAGGSCIISRN
jgi:Transglycosylase SLT domain/SPOR domain